MLLTAIFVSIKIDWDLSTYKMMVTNFQLDGTQPSLFAGGIKVSLLYGLPILIAMILAVISKKRYQRFSTAAILVSVLGLIYTLTPVGFIIALNAIK